MPFDYGVKSFNGRQGTVVPQSDDYAAFYPQPIGKTTSGAAAPIPFFNVKDYGATGNGTSDDTAAIQAAINAAQPANGIVLLPAGTYIVSTPLSVTSPIGVIGQGVVATTIKASVSMSEVVSFTPGGAGGFFRDLTVDGNGFSTYAINQSIATETSVPTEYLRVQAYGATSYQFVNDKCEDVTYIDCIVPGNESSPTSTPYAMLVTVPNGAINIFGGQFFGECSLQYQLITIVGAVVGPIVVSNPTADVNTVLKLDGCYIYDGGPNSSNCIDTSDNLTNITASACYFVAQVDRAWVNGNIPITSLIELDNCVFVWGPGTAGTNYAVQASGGGSININGYSLNIGSATFAYFNPVSSPTTVLSYCDSGNLQSGSSLQAGASGVKLTNTGAIQFLNTGGGDLFSGSGAPPSTLGATGDYYFRTDTPGTSGQRIYVNSAGTWTGIV